MPSGSDQNFPHTSDTLIRRAATLEPVAWVQLVDIYGPLFFRWCGRQGIQESDACDLVQEIFATVFEGLKRFERRNANGSFRAWLRTIFRSRLIDWHRRNSRHAAMQNISVVEHLGLFSTTPDQMKCEEDLDVDSATDRALIARKLLNTIQSDFHADTWKAFWMLTIDGRVPLDVADELGMSVWSVYQAKSRVLRRLRRELVELGEQPC